MNIDTKIDFNTILALNHCNFSPYVTSVYISCRILRNNITIPQIKDLLPKIEKCHISENKIRKSLKLLNQINYIRIENGLCYITNQKIAFNFFCMFLRIKNFYNSHIVINEKTFNFYKKESKEKSLHNHLNSYLIATIWEDMPVTQNEISDTILLTKYRIKKLDTNKVSQKLKFNNSIVSAWEDRPFNIVTLGNVYPKDKHNPIKVFLNSFIEKKLGNCSSLSTTLKRRRFARAYLPFFNENRRNHTRKLSECYILSKMRNRKVIT